MSAAPKPEVGTTGTAVATRESRALSPREKLRHELSRFAPSLGDLLPRATRRSASSPGRCSP
jgi:hypothetical protein